MRDLAATARSLRETREAYRNFLILWALEQMTADAKVMARVASDVRLQADRGLTDTRDRDRTHLYRGSILDDR